MGVTAYGIDVSHHQTISNFSSIKANGITFCWHKATEGTTYTDPTFAGRVTGFRNAGVTTGAYHFAQSGSAAAQARHFRAVAGNCLTKGSLWPCLDMEAASVRGNANAFINEFYDTLDAGCLVVYGNLDWFQHTLNPAAWGNRNIVGWIARYNGQPGNPGFVYPKMAAHQHSDAGKVSGISSVDRNVIFNGYTLANLTIGGKAAAAQEDDVSKQDVLDGLREYFNSAWHESRVPGSTAMLSLRDALLNSDAYGYTVTHGKFNEAADSVLFGIGGVRNAGALASEVNKLRTQVTALSAAVEALSGVKGVDTDAVVQAVHDAIGENIRITGTVEVSGQAAEQKEGEAA